MRRSFIQDINNSGKSTLDYVIATHPHTDHIGGMAEVINTFEVKKIYMPKTIHTTAAFENLLNTVEAKKLKIQTAKTGKVVFDYGNLKAEFVAPNKDSYSNLNNYSAVLMLSYNNRHFLFMGDAEQESEAEILSSGFDVSADVLKVGHHGSYTASTQNFIQSVKPSIAIISVGKDNNYEHPAPTTISTLNSFQTDIWRTDEKGTVVVTCDGVNISLKNIAEVIEPNAPPNTSANNSINESNPIVNKQSETVYITNTGTKYHRDGCRYLSKSKISVSLDELDTDKYSPCSVCNPPTQ